VNRSPRYCPDAHADVCLLLEGTYPYIRGGVSTWVRQIIEGMPDVRFSIIFLGSRAADYDEPAYTLPDNLVHLELHFLLGADEVNQSGSPADAEPAQLDARVPWWRRGRVNARRFASNDELHSSLAVTDGALDTAVTAGFTDLMTGPARITDKDLRRSRLSWETIRSKYGEAPLGVDFNHYFWTVRGMHAPLFVLADIVRYRPQADLYHAVSTGYAGFLGAMLQRETGKPYLISEHGIYTKERELDLAQVDWIPADPEPYRVGINDGMSHLRNTWIRFFRSLGRMSYSKADRIFTLYEGNRLRQIEDGAPAEKIEIIPNGVDVQRFRVHRRAPDAAVPPVLALIGRVVPIKDIKTFIRAMRIVRSVIPEAEGWLIGPEDEAPVYTEECKSLARSLDLDSAVKFLGFRKPEEIFPQIGLSVLTSVSEGQPLVLLEGFATGIPALATDVGSCTDLVHGITPEDRALGCAGAVVPIANPARFAAAAVALLSDRSVWESARDAAIARVEAHYDDTGMIERYRMAYANVGLRAATDKAA